MTPRLFKVLHVRSVRLFRSSFTASLKKINKYATVVAENHNLRSVRARSAFAEKNMFASRVRPVSFVRLD